MLGTEASQIASLGETNVTAGGLRSATQALHFEFLPASLQSALNSLPQFVDCHGVIGAVVVAGNGVKIGVTDQVLIIVVVTEQQQAYRSFAAARGSRMQTILLQSGK